jgi:hypothetical protein
LNPPAKTQGFAANPNEEKKRGAESGTPDLFSSFVASLTPEQRGRLLALLIQQT